MMMIYMMMKYLPMPSWKSNANGTKSEFVLHKGHGLLMSIE